MSKNNEYDDVTEDEDYVTDDDVTKDENDDEEDDDEEVSYLETITGEVLEAHVEALNSYVSDPTSPEELTENETIKKFIALKVCEKIMESFESRQQWDDDDQLKKLFQACKRAMKKDSDLDAEDAMKQVLRKTTIIDEVIEKILEVVDDDETEDEE